MWTVKDLMQSQVITIDHTATIRELVHVLSSNGIHGCPVMGPEGKPIGTVSTTDLLWLSDQLMPVVLGTSSRPREARKLLDEQRVESIMTPDVFGVDAEEDLEALSRFFVRTGLRRALVFEGGGLVGVVSISDLLGLIVDQTDGPEGDAGA